jgi:hypothetical protein
VLLCAVAVAISPALISIFNRRSAQNMQMPGGSSRQCTQPLVSVVPVRILAADDQEHILEALDLLLVTDLTPAEFIFSKLGGICWNTKEFLLPPLVLAVIYACRGALAAASVRTL